MGALRLTRWNFGGTWVRPMSAMNDKTASGATSEPGALAVEDDALAGQARPDAFISYRRLPADTAFVDQLQEALAERGKQVWVDRAKISRPPIGRIG